MVRGPVASYCRSVDEQRGRGGARAEADSGTGAEAWAGTGAWAGVGLMAGVAVSAGLASLVSPWWALATVVCAFLTGRRRGRALPAALTLAGVVVADMVAVFTVPSWLTPGSRYAAVVIAVGTVSWCVGRFWRQYAELVRAGWERAERLERERQLVAEQARLRERSRIAQDMHDVLGHDLSLLALSAGALKLAPGLAAEHKQTAEDIRGRAEAAVDRLGEVVGVLREEADGAPARPADTDVARLVEEARASGLPVEARVIGASGVGPPVVVLRAVHRVVQEALTNAARHAPGAAVTVDVTHGAEESRVAVENGPPSEGTAHRTDGRPTAGRTAGGRTVGGRGLVGLDERVRLAGGTFSCGPTPDGGFAISARLPRTRPAQARTQAPALSPQPSVSPSLSPHEPLSPHEQHRRARRALGRTLLVATAVCAPATALLGGALAWWDMLVTERSVLAAEDFARLRPGQDRAEIAAYLPGEQTAHRPAHSPPPPTGHGTTCEYYAMTADLFDDRSGDAYRLCFRAGTLVSAEALRP